MLDKTKKSKPRVPISAAAVAQLIEAMGPDRIVTLDLHCGQIQGFFHKAPVENLFAESEMTKYFQEKTFPKEKLVVVSPDSGAVERAKRAADHLGALGVVTILKRRNVANQVDAMQVVGEVANTICLIVDDIIDTGSTLTKAASILKEKGATSVYAFVTHGCFSKNALELVNNSVLEELCVTNSIPQEENMARCPKLKVLSVVGLIAEAIRRLHNENSLSVLFEDAHNPIS